MNKRVYRVYKDGAFHHIYQNSINGYLVFYSIRDILVFFTTVSVYARRHNIEVLDISIMLDHAHQLVKAPSKQSFFDFVRDYTRTFTKSRNEGPIFNTPFGFAAKTGDKKVKTAIAYLFNNQVEKKLCKLAEESLWNFLAYYHNSHPFSEKIIRKNASRPMRRALLEIDRVFRKGLPVNYPLLDRIALPLKPAEIRQLTDYIITKYNCIDYNKLISFFGTFDNMLLAIHSNTGSEHDIDEVYTPGSDKVYLKLIEKAATWLGYPTLKDLLSASLESRKAAQYKLVWRGWATKEQARKFLRIPVAVRCHRQCRKEQLRRGTAETASSTKRLERSAGKLAEESLFLRK